MLSKIPIDIEKLRKEDLDREILRAAIIAELDAINLYEQMADMSQNKNIRKLLLDVAKEEKTHVGEFQTLLLRQDPQQKDELEEGKKEFKGLLDEGQNTPSRCLRLWLLFPFVKTNLGNQKSLVSPRRS
jgi:rubrerythrin